MSVTIGAALKKIAVALLTDRRNWEKIAVALFAVLLLFSAAYPLRGGHLPGGLRLGQPGIGVRCAGGLGRGQPELPGELQQPAHPAANRVERGGLRIRGISQSPGAILVALSPYAEEADFIEKLVGCFAPEQTNEELVANVNAAFGTDIDPEEFEKILATTASDMVAIAQSQIGQTGGQPYWSWYGFGSRVEWCAISSLGAQTSVATIDAGIVPKFAGCGVGVQWFQNRGQWLPGSATPEPGMLIFFQWYGSDSSIADHVGIVERVENGPGLHHRGNADDQVRQKQLPHRLWRNQGVRCAGYRLERMMTIKLRDYLRLHPNQGVELLTEFGYYTLTKQEIKTQLRKHGAVRSVTGRPLSFDTLLEQEVLDEQPRRPALLRTGRKERRDEPC